MSAGVAKVIIIGNLGKNPETRYARDGTIFLSFSIASSRKFYDRDRNLQERTTWFQVTAWRKLAETMDGLAQNGALVKGRQVYVEGPLETREYTDQNGRQRVSLDVTADDIQLLGPKPDMYKDDKTVFTNNPVASGSKAESPNEFRFEPF